MLEIEVSVPQDISGLVLKSFDVPRFTRIYHEGIFIDNTGDHTVRCVEIAEQLTLPADDLSKLIRMLWVHDLPEIITSDYSIIQKNSDPNLDQNIKRRETLAARKILNPNDQLLFEEFNKGLTPVAMVAKTIDRTEGNMFFHRSLTRWIMSGEYNPLYVPKDEALRYSYQYYKKTLQSLPAFQYLNPTYLKTIQGLLNTQIESIKGYWKAVTEERIPSTIKEEIASTNG